MTKIPVVAVVGPTASGKTALGVHIAGKFNGEIVSADSMQIYKGMDIATAKPTVEEQNGIKHYMLDFLDVNAGYSVADYVKDASRCIKEIYDKGKLPVVAGGTGLYIDSLFSATDFGEVPDNREIREKLKAEYERFGGEYMLEKLSLIDSETAEKLHFNDASRIIRAFEVYYLTGETISDRVKMSRLSEPPYDVCYIGINYSDREKLYGRINMRVDMMLESGLCNEAEKYISLPEHSTSKQAIGYKELKPYFNGECSLEEAVDSLKRETRRYAKRQLTWFRKNKNIFWVYPDTDNDFIASADNRIYDFLTKRKGE